MSGRLSFSGTTLLVRCLGSLSSTFDKLSGESLYS